MKTGNKIIRRKGAEQNVEALHKVTALLKTVDFGSITLHVQGGKVFQINRTESCRFPGTIPG
jgi:hypothetical protein